jgi:Ser-tRNA(Ala) deacylase AlaX
MRNLYLENAYIKELKTSVIEMRQVKKKPALYLEENIFYPGGGGQPHDLGQIKTMAGQVAHVSRVLKLDGKNFICLSDNIGVEPNAKITATIDWKRRYGFMRYHTAAHVLMGSVKRNLSDYLPEGIEIGENGTSCEIHFSGFWDESLKSVENIFSEANDVIKEDRLVEYREYSKLSEVLTDYSSIYRGPADLAGKVRIVVIKDWDANPCGGTHVRSLSEVGTIKLRNFNSTSIVFTIDQ